MAVLLLFSCANKFVQLNIIIKTLDIFIYIVWAKLMHSNTSTLIHKNMWARFVRSLFGIKEILLNLIIDDHYFFLGKTISGNFQLKKLDCEKFQDIQENKTKT